MITLSNNRKCDLDFIFGYTIAKTSLQILEKYLLFTNSPPLFQNFLIPQGFVLKI